MKQSKDYKLLYTSYHLLENEIYTSIYETIDELISRENMYIFSLTPSFQGSIKNIDQFLISSWVSEAISQEINSTVRQFIQETVASFMEDQKKETVLDLLLSEILLEFNFKETGLKNADLITKTANLQLANGEINYLDWVQLINQSTNVRSDYVDATKSLNQSIIQLNYLKPNN